jgi:hypothetical protein
VLVVGTEMTLEVFRTHQTRTIGIVDKGVVGRIETAGCLLVEALTKSALWPLQALQVEMKAGIVVGRFMVQDQQDPLDGPMPALGSHAHERSLLRK